MVKDIGFDYCDIELFALEMNQYHSVIFEITPKYCILDSFVDYEGYSFLLRYSSAHLQTKCSSELTSPIPVHFKVAYSLFIIYFFLAVLGLYCHESCF